VDLQIILQAHAATLKLHSGTPVPFARTNLTYVGDYGTAKGEQERQKLDVPSYENP
jgi:hypothetical protein